MNKTKKQYHCIQNSSGRYVISTYHNGDLKTTIQIGYASEMKEYIQSLERQGYTRGYTSDEIEEAKQIYQEMLFNEIVEQ